MLEKIEPDFPRKKIKILERKRMMSPEPIPSKKLNQMCFKSPYGAEKQCSKDKLLFPDNKTLFEHRRKSHGIRITAGTPDILSLPKKSTSSNNSSSNNSQNGKNSSIKMSGSDRFDSLSSNF